MSTEKSDSAGSILANPNALLALVTIAGGLWLVSNKLTSDRPVTPAGGPQPFVADQNLESRLWEDPFKNVNASDGRAGERGNKTVGNLSTLLNQISRPNRTGGVLL